MVKKRYETILRRQNWQYNFNWARFLLSKLFCVRLCFYSSELLQHVCKSVEILNESYEVVQLSYKQQYLLISTTFRSIICFHSDKWKVCQVGKKDRKMWVSFLGILGCNTFDFVVLVNLGVSYAKKASNQMIWFCIAWGQGCAFGLQTLKGTSRRLYCLK